MAITGSNYYDNESDINITMNCLDCDLNVQISNFSLYVKLYQTVIRLYRTNEKCSNP